MRLALEGRTPIGTRTTPAFSARWATVAIGAGLAGVFVVDWSTGTVPFQHLYYLPIVAAAQLFGVAGALVSSLAAVALYHVANPALLTLAHTRSDVVQIVLFFVIGGVTARLRDNARRYEALSTTDDLTGLHNLRGFEQRLRAAVRAARDAGTPLSMLVVDLDHLKALNDEHGHLAGAEAVRTVGHLIAEHLPACAFACRYGGDEFAVALPGQSAVEADTTATKILRSVDEAAPVLAGIAFAPGSLSVSIGLAWSDGHAGAPLGSLEQDDGEAGEILFRAADAALYKAKRTGRSRVCTT